MVASPFALPTDALPPLREDLALVPGPRGRSGAPSWTIHDPVRNKFFRIGPVAFALLGRWHLGTAAALIDAITQETGRAPREGEIDWMTHFLRSNMLVRREAPDDVAGLRAIAKAAKSNWSSWLVHHYLFFRIPLVRPQRFLVATQGVAAAAVSPPALMLLAGLGFLGLFLAARQWDGFQSTFLHFFSFDGLLWYGLALGLAKVLHELGHAYTSVRMGCRVPSMGVAFLVMWPVLYTDTTDAWRLTDKRQRLMIGAAGMATELALALLATFLWNVLPDGPLRSAAFVTATVTWVMTLAVNLNPFMRFDGYYLLSDWLEVENLQDRAFARAKWWLREVLFGFGDPPPEPFPKALGRGLVVYAYATWIYRFFLFLGIAVLVYAFAFKVLGILLFVIEIAWFIVLPVVREVLAWSKRRADMTLNARSAVSLGVGLAVIALLVIPWRTSIGMPAVVEAADRAMIYAPVPARIEAIHVEQGDLVTQGQALFTLSSTTLEQGIVQARQRVALRQILVRRAAAGGTERERINILQNDLESQQTQLDGLLRQRDRLTVRSPVTGRVAEFDRTLHEGLWINPEQALALVVAPGAARVIAFIEERDLSRITRDNEAVFIADDPAAPSIAARVSEISDVNAATLDRPALASVHGGGVAVEPVGASTLVPVHGVYRVTLTPTDPMAAPAMVARGVARVDGQAASLIVRTWEKVWTILIRESGF